ncbi:hypothetical protein HPB47_000012 [Ixodes persulcatus]|uniref:Uncharacterized protein n=1 Tax=Ixodes persulcatus TaxID=34615 RepID=A0AC60PSV5_IXOPE|nr:hypothetical protein HPB47_000012 [Ixodes persulcatus]
MAAPSESAEARCVELGFLEKCEPWAVKSKYFPSKVGGKPAWLHLKNIPDGERLSCQNCGEPCAFLLQVYAPIDDVDSAFHRTLFVFVCVAPGCLNKNKTGSFIILRSQLPRINSFYEQEPPIETEEGSDSPSASDFSKLCVVCGALGNKTCAKCRSRNYCSKSHQVTDWKSGHKSQCGSQTDHPATSATTRALFPEYELITEPEDEACGSRAADKSDEQRLSDYRAFLSKHPQCSDIDSTVNATDLNNMAATCKDKAFWKFKKVIEMAPEQVLRYDLGGSPVLVSSEDKPNAVPDCSCGSERQFEFQVLPQLLNTIVESNSESLDWGTLIAYTCKRSCDGDKPYLNEFMWKQNFSEQE